jgi:molybdenum cofactor cytidylyltransferase
MLLSTALRLAPTADQPEIVAFVGGGGKSSALFRLANELTAQGVRVITATTTRIAAHQIEQAPAFVPVTGLALPLAQIVTALDTHHQVLLIGRETIVGGPVAKKAGIEPMLVDELVHHAPALGVGAFLVEADGSRMLPAKAPAAHEPVIPASTTLLSPILGLDAIGLPLDEAHLHRPDRIRTLLGKGAIEHEAFSLRLTPADAAHLLAHPQGGFKGRPANARVIALLNKADTPPRLAVGRLAAAHLTAQGVISLVTTLASKNAVPVRARFGPVSAVILAAGGSTRMGRTKQLIEVEGVPLIAHALRAALTSGVEEVVVVTGAAADGVTNAVRAFVPTTDAGRVRIVHNPLWPSGQASSVHAALNVTAGATEAMLFLPVDQPHVRPLLLQRLIRAWEEGARLAAPRVGGAVRGAPALFDRSLWPELRDLHGDVGGRPLLRKYQAEVVGVSAQASDLRDIDRPADLAALGASEL